MKQKLIVVLRADDQDSYPLDKDRIVLGRDKSCDIVLNDESVSRKHAAIIHKYGSVYIENISTTGQIIKGEEPVEYIQLQENEEVAVGPFLIFWENGELGRQAGEGSAPATEASADSAPREAGNSNPAAFGNSAPVPEPESPALGDNVMVIEGQSSDAADAEIAPNSGEQFEAISDERTVAAKDNIHPVLKVVKGEKIGREIRLDYGVQWVVGRSAKSHVHVDNNKLSRQHFKIIKIGQAYRVQDLDSAYGTRVNGVAVTDAPLQPFDTIQAGPVELQFLIVDSAKVAAAPSGGALAVLEGNAAGPGVFAGGGDNTQFAPPVPYTAPPAGPSGNDFGQIPPSFDFAGAASVADPRAAGIATKESSLTKAKVWFDAQPTQKKVLYGVALCLILALVGISLMPTKNAAPVALQTPADSARKPASTKIDEGNAADARDISPEFNLLSPEKQNEIRELYGKAERARASKDWRTAFDSAKGVLAQVKRYRNAADILGEAQTYLNEGQIGLISKSLSNVEEAAADNEERIKLYLENGDKALKESRWDDAQEAYQKALNLDPVNERATQGLVKAQAKDLTASVEVPNAPVTVNPDEQEALREQQSLDGFRARYQEARLKVQNNNHAEALPMLRDLESQLADRADEYSSGGRGPASVRGKLAEDTKSLLSQVREGIETSKTQMRAEYQTQLADADQFISNRQYAEAREVYDRILRVDPSFDDVLEARDRLYTKILTEARTVYQESLIYESVGDLDNAATGFEKTKSLLTNVRSPAAVDYYKKALFKLRRLQKGV